jgi:glycosyltransferase involved in cell wall biosynthesis
LGLKLKIVGTGTEVESLKARALPNIEFLGRIPDDELNSIFSRCLALVFPQEEDFGITPLEAMAAGRPVIAYKKGGALETVVEGKTGTFFEEQNAQSLVEAVRAFRPEIYQPDVLHDHAMKYDDKVFKGSIQNLVNNAWNGSHEESAEATKREPSGLPT